MNHEYCVEEDEIDLKELILTLSKWKKFIIIFTTIITTLSVIYVLSKTPIYEVTSNVQIGYIGKNLVNEPDTIAKVAKIVFKVDEKHDINDTVKSYVSDISLNKKIKNFLLIKSDGISNEEALKLNKKVVKYIQNMYEPLINEFIKNNKIKIKELEKKIYDIDHFKKDKIKNQIEVLKNQEIAKIDEKIKKIKEQDIANLKQQINLLKTQDIAKIDEKIDFLKNVKIKTLQEKIRFHKEKLLEYSKAIKKIYDYNKNTKDKATLSIASMQIVNYQNLILNSQNKIEDFKEAIEKIKNETIPNLLRQKENILEVKIKKLQQQIDNLKNITIVNLLRQKKNIENTQIKQLEYQLNIDLPNQKAKLQDQIEQLEFKNTKQYVQNSHVVGDYVIKNYPIKPKKKLIVIVAFITGLILSIFLVFILEFFKEVEEEIHEAETKEEDKK